MDSAIEKDRTQLQNNNFGTFQVFTCITITTWPEALLVNMNKLVLMFHGKFHCINTINVRKKNLVQMRPWTAEIKNNNKIPNDSVIRNKKNISRGNILKKNFV